MTRRRTHRSRVAGGRGAGRRPRGRYSAPAGPHLVVTIDPGGKRADGRACGVSVWLAAVGAGVLLGAGHVAAADVVAFVEAVAVRGGVDGALPQAWLVEVPHLRGDQHAKRRGVDALRRTLAYLRKRRPPGSTWRQVRPHAWKGNVPKAIHHARTLAHLRPTEVERVAAGALDPAAEGYQHDTADAVALGAWAIGRIGRGGTRPPGAAGGAAGA